MRLVFMISWQIEMAKLSALKGGGSIFLRIYTVPKYSKYSVVIQKAQLSRLKN